MPTTNANDYFATSDLSLVATLLCLGYGIESVDKSNTSRTTFCFSRDKFLDESVQAFWSHTLTVDPLTYFNCLKEAKTRLYGRS